MSKFFREVAAIAAAGSLVLAGTASASSLSLSTAAQGDSSAIAQVRAGAGLKKTNKATAPFLIPAVAIVAIIGGAIILSSEDDEPESP